ncbi:MAG: outer membrane protein transport protein [Vicinamibacterales bacterium]|nr:outer membrane protein transport protein [Vicinamibacterales bacterium]
MPGTQPIPGLGRVVGEATFLQLAPTVAYALSDRVSIGVAPTPTLAKIGTMPLAFAAPNDANGDGLPTYPAGLGTRSHWGAGFQVGLFVSGAGPWRFGVSYKSPQWFDDFEFVTTDELGGDRRVTLDFDYPSIVSAGASFVGVDDLTIAVDVRYLDYEDTNGFEAAGFDGTGAVTGLGWRSVVSLGVGAECRATSRLSFRGGYAYNDNPIPAANTFFNVAAPLVVTQVVSAGASVGVTDRVGVDLSFVRGLRNTVSGPFHVPGVGALPVVTSITSEVAANAFDVGLVTRF